MRASLLILVVAGACHVPDKAPANGDGGIDAPSGPIDTMITDAPVEFSNMALATFRFTSSLATAHFECRVDMRPAEPCVSPFEVHLDDGSHSFSVRAIDGSGEGDDSPAEHLWMTDTVAPNTTLTETPPAADNSTTVRFSFTSNEQNV